MTWHDLTGDQQTELINLYLSEQRKKTSPENVNRARDALTSNNGLVLRLVREAGYKSMGNAIDNPDGADIKETDAGGKSITIVINIGD